MFYYTVRCICPCCADVTVLHIITRSTHIEFPLSAGSYVFQATGLVPEHRSMHRNFSMAGQRSVGHFATSLASQASAFALDETEIETVLGGAAMLCYFVVLTSAKHFAAVLWATSMMT